MCDQSFYDKIRKNNKRKQYTRRVELRRANRKLNRKSNTYLEHDNRRGKGKKQRALDNATRYEKGFRLYKSNIA